MKRLMQCLAILLILPVSDALAIAKAYSVQERIPVIEEGRTTYQTNGRPYDFRVEILGDSDGLKTEEYREGRFWVTAKKDERYAIRLYNPLPVRAAVNL